MFIGMHYDIINQSVSDIHTFEIGVQRVGSLAWEFSHIKRTQLAKIRAYRCGQVRAGSTNNASRVPTVPKQNFGCLRVPIQKFFSRIEIRHKNQAPTKFTGSANRRPVLVFAVAEPGQEWRLLHRRINKPFCCMCDCLVLNVILTGTCVSAPEIQCDPVDLDCRCSR